MNSGKGWVFNDTRILNSRTKMILDSSFSNSVREKEATRMAQQYVQIKLADSAHIEGIGNNVTTDATSDWKCNCRYAYHIN